MELLSGKTVILKAPVKAGAFFFWKEDAISYVISGLTRDDINTQKSSFLFSSRINHLTRCPLA
jgi:hypothetical protein